MNQTVLSPSQKSNEGSSSILVIIMMVVLMLFGLAILTTSLSNVRLSNKKRDWIQSYYALEAQAETEIGFIDQLLLSAEEDAMTKRDNTSDDDQTQSYAALYQEIATQMVLSHIAGDANATLMIQGVSGKTSDDAQLPSTAVTFEKSSQEDDYMKHVTVTMRLEIPTKENLDENGRMFRRFTIENYYEWQDAFEYEEEFDFEDPFEDAIDIESDGDPFPNN